MKKSAIVLTLTILLLAVAVTIGFANDKVAAAEEIKIYPDSTSSYAAYGNAIAYTTEKNELVLAAEGASFTLKDAYAGKSRSIAMNGDYIFLLSVVHGESKETVSFTAFPYTLDPVSVASGTNALGLFSNVTGEEIADNEFFVNEKTSNGLTMGGYDFIYIDSSDKIYCMARAEQPYSGGVPAADCVFFGDLTTMQWNRQGISLKNFSSSADFFVVKETIYFNAGGKLYTTSTSTGAESNLQLGDLNVSSLAYADGIVYALADDGIYAVNPAGFTYKKLLDEKFDGKLRIMEVDDTTYLLAQSVENKNIKQYICKGTFDDATLEYFNVFDGIIYQDPTEFSLLRVGKANAEINAYFSPKNLKIEYSLEQGDYVLALAKQDGFYYVRNEEGNVAYVKESELTLLNASETTDIGKYAQALHDGTSVYVYPYVSDDVAATVTLDDILVIVDNVAVDGDTQVWGWYHVCIIGEDGTLTYGYLQKEYASKYTNFNLPSFSKDATVSAESLGGIINVYLLPDEESEVLGTLTDGDKITLAQDKLDTDTEWTKIVYKDMVGYVRTANLITEGITPLQVTLIVVFAVVIVATAIVVVLVVKKRRAQRFDY